MSSRLAPVELRVAADGERRRAVFAEGELEVVEDDAAVAQADVQRPRGRERCSETRTLNSGKVASMRSVSIEVSLPPSCRFAVRLPAAGSDAVFGDIASALAMSVTLICTSPESVPSVADAAVAVDASELPPRSRAR